MGVEYMNHVALRHDRNLQAGVFQTRFANQLYAQTIVRRCMGGCAYGSAEFG